MAERNPSKQKRAAQNKAQREALAARRRAAAVPKPGLKPAAGAPAEAAEPTEKPSRRRSRARATPAKTASGRPSRTAPAKTESGRPSRSAPERPTQAERPAASAPAETTRSGRPIKPTGPDHPAEPGLRGFMAHLQEIAGGKAVLFAFIFAVVAAGIVLFSSVVQQEVVEAPGQVVDRVLEDRGQKVTDRSDEDPVTDPTNIVEAVGPQGIALAVVPIIITGIALEGSRRPRRRRLYTITAFALGLYVVFLPFIGIFFFFSMGGLFFAAYQARKADPPVPRTRARRGAAADSEDEG